MPRSSFRAALYCPARDKLLDETVVKLFSSHIGVTPSIRITVWETPQAAIEVTKNVGFSRFSEQLSGRALPSHGRDHWFNPSRAHHFTLVFLRLSLVANAGFICISTDTAPRM